MWFRKQNTTNGPVCDAAITENIPNEMNIQLICCKLNSINIAANVYDPSDYDSRSDKEYPAVTVASANSIIKEQVSGLFAQKLAINNPNESLQDKDRKACQSCIMKTDK